jgi:hypothetical protein
VYGPHLRIRDRHATRPIYGDDGMPLRERQLCGQPPDPAGRAGYCNTHDLQTLPVGEFPPPKRAP